MRSRKGAQLEHVLDSVCVWKGQSEMGVVYSFISFIFFRVRRGSFISFTFFYFGY